MIGIRLYKIGFSGVVFNLSSICTYHTAARFGRLFSWCPP